MLTVILSAGHSTRFTHDGFVYQKSMLPMPDGRMLLEWQLERLPGDRFLYISRDEYRNSEASLMVRIRRKNHPLKAVFITKKTEGPLDGLWNMRKHLYVDEELLIAYNDELIEQESLIGFVDVCSTQDYPAGLVCFETDNPRFTPLPNYNDFSAGCTYYFRSGKEFIQTITSLPRGPNDGCPSAVYAYVRWLNFYLGPKEFVELGTAREYKLWAASHGMTTEEIGF